MSDNACMECKSQPNVPFMSCTWIQYRTSERDPFYDDLKAPSSADDGTSEGSFQPENDAEEYHARVKVGGDQANAEDPDRI